MLLLQIKKDEKLSPQCGCLNLQCLGCESYAPQLDIMQRIAADKNGIF
jgi:hypothetical protein